MTQPIAFFVGPDGFPTKNGITIATDGTIQFVTLDATGKQVLSSGGGGASSFSQLTDGTTANLPVLNAPTAAALAVKANASDLATTNSAVTSNSNALLTKLAYSGSWNASTNVVTGVTGVTTLTNAAPSGQVTSFKNTAAGPITVNYLGAAVSAQPIQINDSVSWNGVTLAWEYYPYAQTLAAAPDYTNNLVTPLAGKLAYAGLFTNLTALQAFATPTTGMQADVGTVAPFLHYSYNGTAWVVSGAGGPTAATFANAWGTTSANGVDMSSFTVAGALALTSSDSGSVRGGYTQATIIANGTNIPTGDGAALPGYVNTNGVANAVKLTNIGGYKYWGANGTNGVGAVVNVPTAPTIATPASITQAQVGKVVTFTAASGVTGYPAPALQYDLYVGGTTLLASNVTSGSYTVLSANSGNSLTVRATASNGTAPNAVATSTASNILPANVNGAVPAPTLDGGLLPTFSIDFGDATTVTTTSGQLGDGSRIISVAGSDGTTYTFNEVSGSGPISVVRNGQLTAQFIGSSADYMLCSSDLGLIAAGGGTLVAVVEPTSTTLNATYLCVAQGSQNYLGNRYELAATTGSGVSSGYSASKSNANIRSIAYSGAGITSGPHLLIGEFPIGTSATSLNFDGAATPITSGTSAGKPVGLDTAVIGTSRQAGANTTYASAYITRFLGYVGTLLTANQLEQTATQYNTAYNTPNVA